ncbi:MAG TPA: HlyD family secretion protein [Saprospiraceae bacterium]|nr:HlyD family secretion protein [Saprospiraceae bacterium]
MEETKQNKSSRKLITRIIFLSLLVIGSIYGYMKYREAKGYETTDDAQLDTDISPVTARVSGYIDKVYFSDNQSVKMGDTLVLLDNRDLKIKVEQAEAALQNAQAGLGSTKASAYSVEEGGNTSTFKIDELKVRLASAQNEYERYQKMLAEGSTTQQQFDKVKTEKESLERQVETALQFQKESSSKTGAANKQISVAESIIKQRQTDLNYAKLQLSYATIVAPFDGIVSKKNALTGQLIQAGQPLCSMVNDKHIWVVANFKETQISKIKEGMDVAVKVDAFPDKIITGKVLSSSPATGSKFSLIPADNASGNYVKVVQRIPIKIGLNYSDNDLSGLKPGMSVYVKVSLKESTQPESGDPVEKATTGVNK